MQRLFPFFIVMFSIRSCFGGLTFPSEQVDVHPSLAETNVPVQFTFTNSGTTPVVIKSVKTSCSCTTASSNKQFFAPGDEGKISAVYQSNGKPGLVQKQVLVETDDADHPIEVLNFRVFVPESATLDPASLSWTINEASKAKVIKIHIADGSGAGILHVSSTIPSISASLKSVTPNKEYEISVIPSSTKQPMAGTLIIETNLTGLKKYLHADISVTPSN